VTEAVVVHARMPKQALLVIAYEDSKFVAWYNGVELSNVAVEELSMSTNIPGTIDVRLVMRGTMSEEMKRVQS
jgi:hypothetical protein